MSKARLSSFVGSSDAEVEAGVPGAVEIAVDPVAEPTTDPGRDTARRPDPSRGKDCGVMDRASGDWLLRAGDDASSDGEMAKGIGELPMCVIGETFDSAGDVARKIGEAKCGNEACTERIGGTAAWSEGGTGPKGVDGSPGTELSASGFDLDPERFLCGDN